MKPNSQLQSILALVSPITTLAIAAALTFTLHGCSDSPSSTINNSSPETTAYQETVVAESEVLSPEYHESEFAGNQLPNGESPLDDCFGRGKYAGQAWIEFKNGNSSDAVVCLVNLYSSKTVRNEYIQAGTNFKMSKIPAGTYYLKTYQGNDWNPTRRNFCGTGGGFDSNEHYSTSDAPGDHIVVESSASGYTTGYITLYQVDNGNMTTAAMTPEEFFNN